MKGKAFAIAGIVLCLVVGTTGAIARHLHQTTLNADLLDAVKSRDVGWAQALLNQGAETEVRNYEDFDGPNWREDELTPLALAIVHDDVPMVKMLLEHGANVNAKTAAYGNFPPRDMILCSAAQQGDIRIAALLIDKGARVDVRGASGATPLMIAAESRKPQMVSWLLRKGADVNALDDRRFTPLHFVHGIQPRGSKESLEARREVIVILKNAGAHL